MLEAAGLLEDALREYSELEAAYLEALQARPAAARAARQPMPRCGLLLEAFVSRH